MTSIIIERVLLKCSMIVTTFTLHMLQFFESNMISIIFKLVQLECSIILAIVYMFEFVAVI